MGCDLGGFALLVAGQVGFVLFVAGQVGLGSLIGRAIRIGRKGLSDDGE